MAPSKNQDWRCCHCGLRLSELGLSAAHGDHLRHQRLCQGCNEDGTPLGIPSECLVPGCRFPRPNGSKSTATSVMSQSGLTLMAWVKHYANKHGITISDECNHRCLRIRYRGDLLPTPDMRSHFGSFYSRGAILTRFEDLNRWAEEDKIDPVGFVDRLPQLLEGYRDQFQ